MTTVNATVSVDICLFVFLKKDTSQELKLGLTFKNDNKNTHYQGED
jgi:hypothetical protein